MSPPVTNTSVLLLAVCKDRTDWKSVGFIKFKSVENAVKVEFGLIKVSIFWFVGKRGHKSTAIKGDQHINATTTTRNVSLAVLNSSLS